MKPQKKSQQKQKVKNRQPVSVVKVTVIKGRRVFLVKKIAAEKQPKPSSVPKPPKVLLRTSQRLLAGRAPSSSSVSSAPGFGSRKWVAICSGGLPSLGKRR